MFALPVYRVAMISCLLSCGLFVRGIHAQQFSGIQALAGRPFVTGVTPVIGPSGAVGGVSVDVDGVLRRPAEKELERLSAQRLAALQPRGNDDELNTSLRMISLRALDEALGKHVEDQSELPEELFFLGGLQRVEYVFAYPALGDVVIAGPAESWTVGESGTVVGQHSARPTMRLDDLMEALRTAEAARGGGIQCSIEPTPAGLERYASLIKARRLNFNRASMAAIERAIGPQQVIVRGVTPDGHFARSMVAADYVMKRLAMGVEQSRVAELPSYLDMLRREQESGEVTSPRWWMTVDYQPLLHSPNRLAWQIRGRGIKTMTEDSVLGADGRRISLAEENPVAQQWADRMTERVEALMIAYPAFGELRNCMDLAIAAALIADRDLLRAANCELQFLTDPTLVRGPQYTVPKTVDSEVSFVRARAGWIVSVSGGVDVDSWSVVERVEQSSGVGETARRVRHRADHKWWW